MENNPKRIGISAGMIQSGKSGVGRYVVELVRALQDANDPDCMEFFLFGLDEDRPLFPSVNDKHWISIPAYGSRGILNLIWHQFFLGRICERLNLDLLHIPSYRRIVRFPGVLQLATIHDCAPFRLRDKYGFLRGIFGRIIVPALARRCARIVAVSSATASDITEFMGIPSDRIDVIFNGIDHNAFKKIEEKSVEQFRVTNSLERPYFFYLSRIEHPGKNHIRLIEAYENFRRHTDQSVQLLFGGADWHGAIVVKERAADSPYSNDIKFLGFVDDTMIPYYLNAARGVVFPSLMEGFGLPVAEALACGTPVASSDRGSLPEVGGNAAIYFDPENIGAISRALETLASLNEGQLAGRREDGYAQAGQFSWIRCARETKRIYQELLSKQP